MIMIERYILPVEISEAKPLLEEWRWLVHDSYKAMLLTKFGDWFFATPSGVFSSLIS